MFSLAWVSNILWARSSDPYSWPAAARAEIVNVTLADASGERIFY